MLWRDDTEEKEEQERTWTTDREGERREEGVRNTVSAESQVRLYVFQKKETLGSWGRSAGRMCMLNERRT